MKDFLDILLDILRNSILVTGLVIIMMLMIEYINIDSRGRLFTKLRRSRFGQVVLGAALGVVPGCIGGFATVSLYSHRLLSFGALVAMMIASSGDEAFVMLAMFPKQALILSAVLFVIAVVVGLLVDRFRKKKDDTVHMGCDEEYQLHDADQNKSVSEKPSFKNMRHPCVERIALLLGVGWFIFALAFGMLEHDHAHEGESVTNEASVAEATHHSDMAYHQALEAEAPEHHVTQLNIFDEYWINLIFAIISLFVIYFIATASDHIIKEHLWNHVIRKHCLPIFLWTFGALFVIQIGLHYCNLESWISTNMIWMILFAVLIGIIPESGPHLLFVTLFAAGVVPFSVLLASSISQDGHASLPLLAESKSSFIKSKLINAVVAAFFGYICYFIGF